MLKVIIRNLVPDYIIPLCDHTVDGEELFAWLRKIDLCDWEQHGDHIAFYLWVVEKKDKIIRLGHAASYSCCITCNDDLIQFLLMLDHVNQKISSLYSPSHTAPDNRQGELSLGCNIL